MRYLIALLVLLAGCSTGPVAQSGGATAPKYAVEASWPKALPNNWILGQVSGIAVDAKDNIWVIHRPRTLTEDERAATFSPPRTMCCVPAPPVLEFDAEGNLLASWGGAGQGYDWPLNEHGIHVDYKGNVWVAGNDNKDHQILKFTREGKFLLQIGKAGQTNGSNDAALLGRPAHMEVDPAANELFVADGYKNRRIIVFDADTGQYKRHWGAYGKRPDDAATPAYKPGQPPSQQFATPHCARLSRDGLLYVCDRVNDRIQVFRKDGTFVTEYFIGTNTLASGSVWDLALSQDPGQSYLHIVDGANNRVWTVLRANGKVVSTFGRSGRNAGQFHWVHNVAIDSKGNLYTSEVDTGKRAQKFKYLGEYPAEQ
jgi:DNA-binding beta-propeller fold protein YncE